MASYTTNLNLKKPAGSENVAIGDINNNMDTIDTAYGTLNSKLGLQVSGTLDASADATTVSYPSGKTKDNFQLQSFGFYRSPNWYYDGRAVSIALTNNGIYIEINTSGGYSYIKGSQFVINYY